MADDRAGTIPQRLNAVERDTLRLLFGLAEGATGRHVVCSLSEIAERTASSARTAARTIARLRARGLITTRRRQRSAALVALTNAALPHCGTAAITVDLEPRQLLEPTIADRARKIGVPVPDSFIGDINAYTVMMILERPERKTAAPIDLARRYLDNAPAREQVRLETLKDSDSLYPEYVTLTGYAPLDEGLRTLAMQRRRRHMVREAEISAAAKPLRETE